MRSDFDIAAFDPHPAFRAKRGFRPDGTRRVPKRSANVWPLPSIGNARPLVQPQREGVSFLYARCDLGSLPAFLPVFAVADAFVEYAGKAVDTHSIVLDHGDGHRSVYHGLAHMFVVATSKQLSPQRVRAGDVIGYQPPHLHSDLRFSITRRDIAGHFHPIDPADRMQSWTVPALADDGTTPPTQELTA